jgi:transglutaminase-like putative cysteine protease
MVRTGRVARWAVMLLALALTPAGAADDPHESWDAVYIHGQRCGYIHLSVQSVKDGARDLVRVRIDETFSFKRGKDPVTMEVMYGTIENPDGQVLRLDTRTLASRNEMRTYGDVVDNKMKLILEGTGQRQEQVVPWGPEVRGPYGAEMSMSRKPMEPGETREVRIFVPSLNRIGVARLSAKQVESVQLGGGVKRELLRVEQVTSLDEKPLAEMSGTHWVDSSGQILRTFIDVFGGMETYRTTREAALKNVTRGQFDLTEASLVKVGRRIIKPYESRGVVYTLTMKGDEPAKHFPTDRRQSVTPQPDATQARMVVSAAGPNDGETGPETVDAQYTRPNAMIDSEDTTVAALAKRTTAGLDDPWQKAAAIEHWVFENIKKKNFETTFAAASEVARDLSGDCTEHSVLAAAMCRAVGIPSRVAIGLIYDEPRQAFGFHMWDEVYVNRRWVAIDAAFDQSTVDAVHLKLNDSSLDGVSPFEAFLAVARLFGKLSIEPVEVR